MVTKIVYPFLAIAGLQFRQKISPLSDLTAPQRP